MNRSTLRFLGFQHDALSAAGGSQSKRDELLAKIDALADDRREVEPRVGDTVTIRRKTRTSDRVFRARVTSIAPADGFIFVGWETDDGRFGNLEHGKVESFGDRLVGAAS